ncbi:Lcl domain-containing protein [Aquirufa rosea]|uniref:DUF1566 domain-containing protein n=1 Tax=Aquirufa rosea TaxID=2509241 RepID=A0A4Q1BZP4_9BACT|nr:DUF1566 domain-containing protein [Aquirufa rosea]RXK49591.1 DUF1566 domain-containing protein [Aquirufa rosea]
MYSRILIILVIFISSNVVSLAQRANVRAPQEKWGGYVIFEKENHGLIATTKDVGQFDYNQAIAACENLSLNGFDDWRLPTQEEFELIHQKLNFKKMKSNNILKSAWYWTSTEIDQQHAVTHNLNTGMQTHYFKRLSMRVLAVRTF